MKIPAITFKGNLLQTFRAFTGNPLQFLNQYALNPEGISQFNILHHRIVHVSEPKHLKHLLLASQEQYTQSRDRDHMQLLFGNGLLTSTGQHWKKQRALIQPAFGKKNLEKFAEKINYQLGRFPLPTQKTFDLHAYSLNLVNHIIADLTFSRTDAGTLQTGNQLMDLKAETLARLQHFSPPLWLPTPANLRYKKRRKTVYNFIQKLITKRKESGENHPDLLDAFRLASNKTTGKGMSEEELREELLGVYAAAHEPVAIALTYTLFLVANHPEVAAKLQQEAQKILTGPEPNFKTIEKLVYTKQVAQEALRLYPPVWISGKRALQPHNLNGYDIRKNDNFIFSPMIVHRHPDHWPEPDKFMPERF
ncbi:MAG TPA: cytochrome P450, partial [Adhaeribacter sp.]|nr:cytochrome P450 [Adhaeribacter sp.]